MSAGSGGGRSHAGARRRCWCQAHLAASLAHVLWAVHCIRIFFLRRVKPPTEIAFDSGGPKISIPGFIQHNLVFNSHHTSTDFADFLAGPSPLHKCIQRKVHAKRRRRLLITDLGFDLCARVAAPQFRPAPPQNNACKAVRLWYNDYRVILRLDAVLPFFFLRPGGNHNSLIILVFTP